MDWFSTEHAVIIACEYYIYLASFKEELTKSGACNNVTSSDSDCFNLYLQTRNRICKAWFLLWNNTGDVSIVS